MSQSLGKRARAFQVLLRGRGLAFEVVELPDSARTAKDAAQAIGCTVAQIAKSLVFRGTETGKGLLAVVSGDNRADTDRLAELAGEPVVMAEPAFVREQTGYAIGGVPPTGHAMDMTVFIDADLTTFDSVWAAAGTPHAVFCMPATELAHVTGGRIETIGR